VAVAAVVVIGILVFVTTCSSGVKSEDTSTGEPSPPVSEPAAPGLETPVRDGKFEFVVENVQSGVPSVGDVLISNAQGEYTLVTVRVTNIGDEAQYLDVTSQKLVDDKGRKFDNDVSAQLSHDQESFSLDTINPGNTVTIPFVYDMPAGATPTSIILHDSMLSNGVTVKLN